MINMVAAAVGDERGREPRGTENKKEMRQEALLMNFSLERGRSFKI